MKLRLADGAVRLRLNEDDVAKFLAAPRIETRLEVGGGSRAWSYRLVASAEADEVGLELDGEGLSVVVPESRARAWARSDEVGLYAEAEGVEITIEKDLGCDHTTRGQRGAPRKR